jgi:hypothetical protein
LQFARRSKLFACVISPKTSRSVARPTLDVAPRSQTAVTQALYDIEMNCFDLELYTNTRVDTPSKCTSQSLSDRDGDSKLNLDSELDFKVRYHASLSHPVTRLAHYARHLDA